MVEAAVQLRGAVKQYGRHSKVLEGLDMTVTTGSIYALLGASGCGKTTLLSCIVGRRRLDSGDIFVLGSKPGTKRSWVPVHRLGYMPQDIGLLGEFSVKGAIFYFGWLYNMSNAHLEERFEFLSRLLDLPPHDRYVKNLSGGQQRRVSFAAALVHEAELLILDEPTVGLDPVLRYSIWEHLATLTMERRVTVIITTHYIEEARQAHMIGLMRQGRLLAEDTPQHLLALYKCPTLEAVFLKLSIRQSERNGTAEGDEPTTKDVDHVELSEIPPAPPAPPAPQEPEHHEVEKARRQFEAGFRLSSLSRMKALLVKNFLGVIRSPGELLFVVLLPLVQVSLFFLAIGRPPQGLRLAVVNLELGNHSDCAEYSRHQLSGLTFWDGDECRFSGLSCAFLARLNDSFATKDYYPDRGGALEAVRSGHAVGALLFAANFTAALEDRGRLGKGVPAPTVENSEVHVHLDMSNEQIGIVLQAMLFEEFKAMAEEVASRCNESSKAVRIPMQFNEPVYGEKYPEYVDYITPRYILSVVYFLSTTLTATVIITDRLEGIWDRNLVAGVTVGETLASHILFQMCCVLIYSAETVLLSLLVFGMRCKGSILTVCLMVLLQGVSGMTYGLVISVLCTSYTVAIFIAVGSLMPFICLSGVVWPIEGMHYLLKYPSMLMPCTMANLSLSHVLEKGWSLLQPQVYGGFLMSLAWVAGQLLLCMLVLRLKH